MRISWAVWGKQGVEEIVLGLVNQSTGNSKITFSDLCSSLKCFIFSQAGAMKIKA